MRTRSASSRVSTSLLLSAALLAGLYASGCASSRKPMIAVPKQDLRAPAPEGMVRVIILNASSGVMETESAPIVIQLDDRQVPTLGAGEYVVLYLSPGTHSLLLEHEDMFVWKSRHDIEVGGETSIFEVFNRPTSTQVKELDALPADFERSFTPTPEFSDW